MKHTFSQREHVILMILVLSVMVSAFYLGVFLPLKTQKEGLRGEIGKVQAMIRKDLRLVSKGEALKAKYRRKMEDFIQTGSDEKVMNELFSQIETAASEGNVQITDRKPGKVKVYQTYSVFPISMSLDADLPTLLRFIHILQQKPYMFDLIDIEIRKLSPRNNQLRCQLQLGRVFLKNPL